MYLGIKIRTTLLHPMSGRQIDLSVVIVNYNVRFFLEQCLASVRSALKGIEGEVWLVDNASADGSVEMVRAKFPEVNLLENKSNVGFSKANNQAIRQARGRYILLLNPDTVVQENTFAKCLAFMDEHPDAGGLTVKMVDGKGRYLPESKRGFPSPWASFCKIFGLSRLLPRSKRFASYYLGHLDINKTHKIEILPGAFMFLRAETLEKTGLLDEQFFMYGEDIDLSYRIIQNGYQNYYYPECQIIHYKGESTKKSSLNYVIVFYKAMILFAQKHLGKQKIRHFILLIKIAVFFRAALSIVKRIIQNVWLPLADILLMAYGALVIIPWWEQFRLGAPNQYPRNILFGLLIFYFLTWFLSLWFYGSYDKPQNRLSSVKGTIIGTIAILVVYSVLPVSFRFSRAIILLLGIWILIFTWLVRLLADISGHNLFKPNPLRKKVLFIGTKNEFEQSLPILSVAGIPAQNISQIEPEEIIDSPFNLKSNIIADAIDAKGVSEVVFGTEKIPMTCIVQTMIYLSPQDIEFKIALHSGESIIGSNSIESQGELYTLEVKALGNRFAKRQKRVFDIVAALIIITLFPLIFVKLHKPLFIFSNAIMVLIGKKTWIGYHPTPDVQLQPKIKPPVFCFKQSYRHDISESQLNSMYARNFSVKTDFKELMENIFRY